MPTLIINAPSYKKSKRSFSKTISTGIGNDYALNSKIYAGATKAKNVIVLDKTHKKKATGVIVGIVLTGNMAGNIPRYNISMSNLKPRPYKSESLNRNGVALI
jgi:hypothetical protein